jgi:excisionase family DNA binding protein
MSKLLTVAEVAERLRIHPMTVRRHIKSGKLRATRVGRSVRVPEESLDDASLSRGTGSDMTREEWLAWARRTPSADELEHRRRVGEEMKRLRTKIDIPTGVLKRAARREDEALEGTKTREEILAEELEYEKSS